MNKLMLSALSIATIASTVPGTAVADSKCNDVVIVVHNTLGAKKEIKVVDIKYKDVEDDKWRDETTNNEQIEYGNQWTWRKNLSYVGGENTQIQVQYRIFDDGDWGGVHGAYSSTGRCNDKGKFEVWVK